MLCRSWGLTRSTGGYVHGFKRWSSAMQVLLSNLTLFQNIFHINNAVLLGPIKTLVRTLERFVPVPSCQR
jgi:hypothetical protein